MVTLYKSFTDSYIIAFKIRISTGQCLKMNEMVFKIVTASCVVQNSQIS